jgi:hypothetical protein
VCFGDGAQPAKVALDDCEPSAGYCTGQSSSYPLDGLRVGVQPKHTSAWRRALEDESGMAASAERAVDHLAAGRWLQAIHRFI